MGDFTMLIHLRGPCELGGFWFLLTILLSMMSCFVSSWLYSNYYDKDDKLSDETLQTVLSVLGAMWITSAVTFTLVINRSHLQTFYNLDTASDYCKKSS